MKNNLSFLYLIFLFFTITSCEKFEIDNSDNANYPIDITLKTSGRDIILNWTEIAVSTFEEYIIVVSMVPINDTPNLNNNSLQIVSRIKDYQQHSDTIREPLTSDVVYCKVFADIGSRFLISPTLEIQKNIKEIPLYFSEATHSETHHQLYFHDNINHLIWSYDYENDIVKSRGLDQYTILKMDIANAGFDEELYTIDNFTENTINIYDAETLAFQDKITSNDVIHSAAVGNNMIVMTVDNTSQPLQIYKRSDLSLLNTLNIEASQGIQNIITISQANNEFFAIGNNRIAYFDFDDNGNLENHSYKDVAYRDLTKKIGSSPDKNYFIGDYTGRIFDKNLNAINELGTSLTFNQYTSYKFSADGTKLFAFSQSNTRIDIFNFPDLTLDDQYNFIFSVNEIFIHDNKLIAIGLPAFTFSSDTMIEIIEM